MSDEPLKLVMAEQVDECQVPGVVESYEFYRWPEFQALLQRLNMMDITNLRNEQYRTAQPIPLEILDTPCE